MARTVIEQAGFYEAPFHTYRRSAAPTAALPTPTVGGCTPRHVSPCELSCVAQAIRRHVS